MKRNATDLFVRSVVVTGTHYSTTTLLGQILGQSSNFHVVHEPLNPQPTLGFYSLAPEQWYRYDTGAPYDALRQGLIAAMGGARPLLPNLLRRMTQVRSGRDILRLGKFTQTNLRLWHSPRRAVFKDPFLAFSAASLQARDGLKVVLCVRHPCAFAESLLRRDRGFDFANLLQPDLLDAVPGSADEIRRFAAHPPSILDQAALLWRVVYEFAAERYLDDPRSLLIRQDDLVAQPEAEVARLFNWLGAAKEPAVMRFVQEALNSGPVADFNARSGSYVHRDGQQALSKWRERLRPDEVEAVRRRVGPIAERYGY